MAAGAALGKAIALSPNNADAWFNLGNAERGLCRFDAAAEGGGLCQGFEVGPGQPAAALNQALLMKEMEQLEKALALFDELVVRHPDHAEDHNGRVACVTSLDWIGGGRTIAGPLSCRRKTKILN